MAEPINVLMGADDPGRFFGYDVTPPKEVAAKIEALYRGRPEYARKGPRAGGDR